MAEEEKSKGGSAKAAAKSPKRGARKRRKAPGFDPANLDRSVLAIPLLEQLKGARRTKKLDLILDLNLAYPGGRDQARDQAVRRMEEVGIDPGKEVDRIKSQYTPQYLFATLTKAELLALVEKDEGPLRGENPRSIYKIWPDFPVRANLDKSCSTVKADAARISFDAVGRGITWAVMDTGVDGSHEHFARHRNLDLDELVHHMDFTTSPAVDLGCDAEHLEDAKGHGTHVAGILAGELTEEWRRERRQKQLPEAVAPGDRPGPVKAAADSIPVVYRERDSAGDVDYKTYSLAEIRGVAPCCKIVSLRVLDGAGDGKVSNLLAALGYVQEVNGYGRWLRVQGINLSLGYPFDAEWFACGQSPLCVEVDRLVRSGVVVVAAAGNTGYGFSQSLEGTTKTGLDLTINDPGNADLAVTVGATHREMPHTYGVSYFSSKGPTGDGRLKPDLVAPGEKIISCAAGKLRAEILGKLQRDGKQVEGSVYTEQSGTSMAAPHVSGAIAAFLSIRREFIGRPEQVKELFLATATDLKRERYFQGHGLVDLMRAIQSV